MILILNWLLPLFFVTILGFFAFFIIQIAAGDFDQIEKRYKLKKKKG